MSMIVRLTCFRPRACWWRQWSVCQYRSRLTANICRRTLVVPPYNTHFANSHSFTALQLCRRLESKIYNLILLFILQVLPSFLIWFGRFWCNHQRIWSERMQVMMVLIKIAISSIVMIGALFRLREMVMFCQRTHKMVVLEWKWATLGLLKTLHINYSIFNVT